MGPDIGIVRSFNDTAMTASSYLGTSVKTSFSDCGTQEYLRILLSKSGHKVNGPFLPGIRLTSRDVSPGEVIRSCANLISDDT